jgi:hypothetical protein
MSWATSYQGSNNIHYNMPPMMNDGRTFKTWTSDQDKLNEDHHQKNHIMSNDEYRKYLTNNASRLIATNTLESSKPVGNFIQFEKTNTNSTPYVYQSRNNRDQPYGYESSDLKNYYLSKQQLNERLYTPSVNIN